MLASHHRARSPQGTPFSPSATSRQAGFSLVELVLAIGIVSFAFVTLFSMVPIGMNVFRQAMDTTVGSQIVHRVINEAQQTDYSTLIAAPTTQRYFDDQGNEVQSVADSIYTVDITVTAPTAMPNASTPDSTSLATVVVRLANNPGHRPAPFDPANPLTYTTYSALIAKNQ